jgi:hypothetical protein
MGRERVGLVDSFHEKDDDTNCDSLPILQIICLHHKILLGIDSCVYKIMAMGYMKYGTDTIE